MSVAAQVNLRKVHDPVSLDTLPPLTRKPQLAPLPHAKRQAVATDAAVLIRASGNVAKAVKDAREFQDPEAARQKALADLKAAEAAAMIKPQKVEAAQVALESLAKQLSELQIKPVVTGEQVQTINTLREMFVKGYTDNHVFMGKHLATVALMDTGLADTDETGLERHLAHVTKRLRFSVEDHAVLIWAKRPLANYLYQNTIGPPSQGLVKLYAQVMLAPDIPELTGIIKAISHEWLDAMVNTLKIDPTDEKKAQAQSAKPVAKRKWYKWS